MPNLALPPINIITLVILQPLGVYLINFPDILISRRLQILAKIKINELFIFVVVVVKA